MLAPAGLVTALVLGFGFVMGGDGDAPGARKTEPVAGPASEIASGEPVDSEGRSTLAKLTGPRVVIKAKPRPKFRVYKPYSFTVASFNVLGHSHTIAGGEAPRFADGPTRMGWTLSGLAGASVDVVGLQELQPQQLGALFARGGGTWSVWPGNELGRWGMANSIAWRKDTFEKIRGATMDIPYFGGQPRMQPYILLRHLKTGQKLWIASFHNPANHGSPGPTPATAGSRRAARSRWPTPWPSPAGRCSSPATSTTARRSSARSPPARS